MEEASAIDCCAMGQAGNFGVIHFSLLEKTGKRMDLQIGYSSKFDQSIWQKSG